MSVKHFRKQKPLLYRNLAAELPAKPQTVHGLSFEWVLMPASGE